MLGASFVPFVLFVPFVALFAALLKELCDQASPTCLMTRTDAGTIVAVEVLVEGNQVAPVRIGLKFVRAKDRSSLICIFQENA